MGHLNVGGKAGVLELHEGSGLDAGIQNRAGAKVRKGSDAGGAAHLGLLDAGLLHDGVIADPGINDPGIGADRTAVADDGLPFQDRAWQKGRADSDLDAGGDVGILNVPDLNAVTDQAVEQAAGHRTLPVGQLLRAGEIEKTVLLGADVGGALEKASDRRVFVERSHPGLTGYHAGVGSASDFQATDMGQIEHRAGDDQEGFLGVGGGGEKHVERISGIIVGGRGQSGVRREADLGRFGEFRGAGQEEPADLGAAQGVGQPAKDRHAQDGMQHQGQLAAGAVAVIHQKYDRRTTIHIQRAPLRKIRS